MSGGSLANIEGLLDGDLQFGLVQAGILHDAAAGEGVFADGRAKGRVLTVVRLYDEIATIVVGPNAEIERFADLRGKRVNVGPEDSGTYSLAKRLLDVAGIGIEGLGSAGSLSPEEHAAALCENRIDAYFYVIGHPNLNTRFALASCASRLMGISQEVRTAVRRAHPYYSTTVIAAGTYDGQEREVASIGVPAILVAADTTSPEVVAQVVRAIQGGRNEFRRLHPVLAHFDDPGAFEIAPAPFHPGVPRNAPASTP
jgi:TRAP transporter TAXI family solute receptor